MRRAIIFRYDSADRRVRAAGAHGMSIEPFAGAHVTVESAPIAGRALATDRVVEVVGDLAGEVTAEFAAVVSEPARLVCAPMAAAGREIGVIFADRLMSAATAGRRRPDAAVDAGQGGGARLGGALGRRPSSSAPASSSSASTSRATSTRG